MSLAVLQASVLQTNGALSVAAGAQITVRTPAGVLATLYEDREGATPTGANPVFADSKGYFRVYVEPGRYDVTVTTSIGAQVYDDIALFADGFTPGDAATADIGTATGEVIGVDEARDYFGLDYETSVLPTISSDFSRNKHELHEQYGNEQKTILQMWDVARDTNGTYRDAAGVIRTAAPAEPRIDYDPVTGRAALLVEEARTRLNTHPTDFDNAAWGKTRATITPNVIMAPDGTMTGDKLVSDTTAGNNHFIAQPIAEFTAGSPYAHSVYVKKAEWEYAVVTMVSAGFSDVFAWINLNTGEITRTLGSPEVHVEQSIDGWWRCSVATTADSTASGTIRIFATNNPTSTVQDGDGVSGIYIWGSQLESALKPSSIILANPESQATRSADNVTRTLGDEFNPREGTIYAFAKVPTGSPVVTLDSDVVTSDSNDWKKYAITYSNSTATDIDFGVGKLKEFKYIPRALSAAELQEMTKI